MRKTQSSSYQHRMDRMYKYPANYQEAVIHRNAHKFGYSSPKMKDGSDTPMCPCCQNYVNTIQLPLDYPTLPDLNPQSGTQIYLLPTAISLYFNFIKVLMVYITMRFLIVDLYNMATTFSQRLCTVLAMRDSKVGRFCLKYVFHLFPNPNGHKAEFEQAMITLSILNFIFIAVCIAFFIWYQIYSYKLYYFLQQNDISEDDFTIFVQGIPSIIHDQHHKTFDQRSFNFKKIIKEQVQSKIKNWIQMLCQKKSPQELQCLPYLQRDFYESVLSKKNVQKFKKSNIVHNISICYDLTELQNLSRLRSSLIDDFVAQRKGVDCPQVEYDSDILEHIPNQIKIINEKYIQLCHLIGQNNNPCFSLSRFVGRVFVTFEYQHYRDFCLRQYDKDSNFLTFNKNKKAKLSLAPKPNDIFWYNMKVSESYRLKQTIYSYFIMLLSLLFLLGGLVALSIWKAEVAEQLGKETLIYKLTSFLFTLSMAFLTFIINVFVSMTLDTLTEMQRCQSKTAKMSSLVLKNVIAKVLNTTVVYFILYQMKPTDPLAPQGVAAKIMGLITFSAQLKIFNDIVQPVSRFKKFISKNKYSCLKKINMFQIQLNSQIQNDQFNLATQYSYYIFMIYIVSFYSVIVPFSNSTMVMIFFIHYWVDKYILFKRMSSPVDFGYRLTKLIIKCFQGSLLVFAIGHFYWNMKINKKVPQMAQYFNTASIVVSAVYILFSYFCPIYIKEKVFGNMFMQNIIPHSYSFYSKANRFNKVYWKENPATCFLQEEENNFQDSQIQKVNKKLARFRSIEFISEQNFNKFQKVAKDAIRIDTYDRDPNTLSQESELDPRSSELNVDEFVDAVPSRMQREIFEREKQQ